MWQMQLMLQEQLAGVQELVEIHRAEKESFKAAILVHSEATAKAEAAALNREDNTVRLTRELEAAKTKLEAPCIQCKNYDREIMQKDSAVSQMQSSLEVAEARSAELLLQRNDLEKRAFDAEKRAEDDEAKLTSAEARVAEAVASQKSVESDLLSVQAQQDRMLQHQTELNNHNAVTNAPHIDQAQSLYTIF